MTPQAMEAAAAQLQNMLTNAAFMEWMNERALAAGINDTTFSGK
jgi:hypothetical protein